MLVGNQIGRGDVQAAKDWYRATNIVAAIVIFILISGFVVFGKQFIMVFTTNEVLLAKCDSVLYIVALGCIPDQWQGYT